MTKTPRRCCVINYFQPCPTPSAKVLACMNRLSSLVAYSIERATIKILVAHYISNTCDLEESNC
jgi:hypothetical protein